MDYDDGWLPTLDTKLRVTEDNIIEYMYFEKPTTTNTTIRKSTAMSENPKVQSLSNDLVRRLLNTKGDLPSEVRSKIVDDYGIKLLTSGYNLEQARRVLLNGVKGYVAKRKRRRGNGRIRIHNTAQESRNGRIKKNFVVQRKEE